MKDNQPPYETLEDLYIEFLLCQEKTQDEEAWIESRYWQGKKDGLRLALSVLAPDAEKARKWAQLQLSSKGSYYVSEKERGLLEKMAGWQTPEAGGNDV